MNLKLFWIGSFLNKNILNTKHCKFIIDDEGDMRESLENNKIINMLNFLCENINCCLSSV